MKRRVFRLAGTAMALAIVLVAAGPAHAQDGMALYGTHGCGNCHSPPTADFLGAPKPGDVDDWSPRRQARGLGGLYSSAINGVDGTAMAARGGSAATDEELRAIVDWMQPELDLYNLHGCSACHDNNVAGAPLPGSAEAWGPRLEARGVSGLYASAINGFGPVMQPRGGSNASDAELRAIVDSMLEGVPRPPPTLIHLSLSPDRVAEDAGATQVTVTAAFPEGAATLSADAVVSITVAAGTAEAADFTAVAPFTVTITAGQGSGMAAFPFTPADDGVPESDETVLVSGTTTAAGITEVTPASLTIPGEGMSLYDSYGCGGCHAPGTGLGAPSPGNEDEWGPRLEARGVSGLYNSAIMGFMGDGLVPMPPRGGTAATDAELRAIVDWMLQGVPLPKPPPTLIDLSLSLASVAEDAGATQVTVTAAFPEGSATLAADAIVTVSVAGDTASAADFAAVSDFMVTIAAGQSSGTASFGFTPVDDRVVEGEETVTVSGATTASGITKVNSATLAITDNDVPASTINLSLDPVRVAEDAGATAVEVTAAFPAGSPTLSTNLAVTVSVAAGTASTDDFAAVTPFTVTITAGQLDGMREFQFTPTDDNAVEGNETLTVSGATTLSGVTVQPATLTIADDDTAAETIKLSLTPTSVNEDAGETRIGVTAAFPVGSATLPTATVVTVSVAGNTATAADFAAVSNFTVTIAAGQVSGAGSFQFTPVDDAAVEGAETLTVSGTTTATGVAVQSATLTINDDDMAANMINLSLEPTSVAEDAGETAMAVTASFPEGSPTLPTATVVTVSVAGDTASVADFAEVSNFTVTIAAGQTSGMGTFQFEPENDKVAEGSETVTVSGSASNFTVQSATLTITDDDARPTSIGLTLTPTSVAEDAGETKVTVEAAFPAAGTTLSTATVVTVSVAGGTASSADFAAVANFTVTIAAGQFSGTGSFQFTPTDDNAVEGAETVTVSGTTTAAGVTVQSATLTINDDDTAASTINLSLTPTSVNEDAGETRIGVTAAFPAGSATLPTATVVTVSVAGNTASSADFTAVSNFTVTIAAGQASGAGSFQFTPTDDNAVEGAETVTVSGTTTATGITVQSATLTINDDDMAANMINLSLEPTSVAEDAGETAVTVMAAFPVGSPTLPAATVVTVSVAGNTASSADFAEVANFTVTIAAGQPSGMATFQFEPENDVIAESDETVTVSGAATSFTVQSATLTITDDDARPTSIGLALNPASVDEDAGATAVTVTAAFPAGGTTLSTATLVTVSVAAGTAQAADFGAVTSFGVTIAAGQFSGTGSFQFTPTDDNAVEDDETVTVSGTTTATGVAVQSATLTINDDDMAANRINLSLSPNNVNEDAGETRIGVTAAFPEGSATLPTDTVVTVSVAGNTASSADFATVGNFMVTIAAGQLSGAGSFQFTPTDDNAVEADETVTVSGTTTAAGITVQSATLTINDDDMAASMINLSLEPTSVAEDAGETAVTVTAAFPVGSATLPTATVVTVSVAGNTASSADFTAVANFTVTIAAGQTSGMATFQFEPENDVIAESSETLTVSGAASNFTVQSATLTITDDDARPTRIGLSLTPTSVDEDAGATAVAVTAAFPAAGTTLSTATLVTVSVAAGTAQAADFGAVTSFGVTIAAGQFSGTSSFQFTPTDDNAVEGAETVTVSGTTTATGVAVQSATLTINDDDMAANRINLSLSPGSVNEDAGETRIGVTAAFPAGSATLPTATVVTVSVAGNSASAADFAAVSDFMVTIAAGQASGAGSFQFTPTDDNAVEGAETVTVSGTTTAAGVTVQSATLTINDDDTAANMIGLELDPTSVAEDAGETAVAVTASFPEGSAMLPAATVVTVSVAGNTASTADFTAVANFTVTIAAGQTSGTGSFQFTPTNDVIAESSETLTVSGTASNFTVPSATLTITDDDARPTSIGLALEPTSVAEDAGETAVAVTAAFPAAGTTLSTATVVTVSVAAGTAQAADFGAVMSFDVTIAAGQFSGTGSFQFTPTDDNAVESDETVTVSGATTAAGVAVQSATLMITDDDAAADTIKLSLSPDNVNEDAGETRIGVTAAFPAGSATLPTATIVTVSVAGNSASASDFAEVSNFMVTIAAGQTSGTGSFQFAPTDDNAVEGAETVTVSGTTTLTGVTVQSAALTINDNDTAASMIGLVLSPTSVAEDAGETAVTVTAAFPAGSATLPTATVVTVSVAGNTASTADFTAVANFTVTIAAGQTSGAGNFQFTPTDDAAVEGSETLTVSGAVTSFTVQSAILTITDDDAPADTISLSLSPASVDEDAAETEVTVTAAFPQGSGTISTDTTVTVSVAGNTASSADFAAVSNFMVTITAGQISGTATFQFSPTDDTVVEGDETLTVSGATTASGITTINSATLTITDDDAPAKTIGLALNPASVGEDANETKVTVTASFPADSPTLLTATVVTVSVTGDSAAAADFAAVSNFMLTIAAGQTSGTGSFQFAPVDDKLVEGSETVIVSGTASGFTIQSATLRLTDDDTAPTMISLALSPTSVAENASETRIGVTAAFPEGSTMLTTDTVMTVSVAGSTASAADFAAVANVTVTIAGGQSSGAGSFQFAPTDDQLVEGDETLTVSGAVTNFTVQSATLTITDDDTAPTMIGLSLSPDSVAEDAGETKVTVTASFPADSTTLLTATVVTVSVAGATAGASDFAAVSNFMVTIAAGQTSGMGSFQFTPTDDNVVESKETLTVSGAATSFTVQSATLSITDDDMAADTISLALSPGSVAEDAGETKVTVTASFPTGGTTLAMATVVTVSVAPDKAQASDFAAVSNFMVTIPAEQISGTGSFQFAPVDDNVVEGAETAIASGTASGFTVRSATLRLTDDDTAPTMIGLALDPNSVAENASETRIGVTAAFPEGSAALLADTVVTVSVAGSTAAASDFAAVSSFMVTISGGQTSGVGSFQFAPTDDKLVEGDETLTVSGAATDFTVQSATLTITDDDTAPTMIGLSLDPASVDEDATATPVAVTASFPADSTMLLTDTVVTVSVAGATAGDSDFAAVLDFMLTIAAGQTTGTGSFQFAPTDDNVVEGDETLTVSGAATNFTVRSATLKITDDDEAADTISLALSPASVAEDADETKVTVTASFPPDGTTLLTTTVVTVSVAPDKAQASDFAAVSNFMVTIAAGQISGTGSFQFAPVDDNVVEGAETVVVSGTASGFTVRSATLTITEDDTAPNMIGLALSPANVAENASETRIGVTAAFPVGSAALLADTVVTVSVAGNTAGDSDFAAVADFMVTIPGGQTSGAGSFQFTPTDDNVVEGRETLTVSGAATDFTVQSASLTITDDDAAADTISLALSPASVAEDADATTVTVTASFPTDSPTLLVDTVVTVSVAGATAGSSDFAAVSNFTATITAGQTTGTGSFQFAPADDNVVEGGETVTVSGVATNFTVRSASLTITDDDMQADTISLSLSPDRVAEDAAATQVAVTAAFPTGSSVLLTATVVSVTVTADTAAASDFAAVSNFAVTIAAGQISGAGSFQFTPTDDNVVEGDETLTVSGTTTASGVTVRSATLTLTDDDMAADAIRLSLAPASVAEDAGGTRVAVTAAFPAGSPTLLTATDVSVTVAAGTAEAGDFAAVTRFTVTIPIGQASGAGSFQFAPVNDTVVEGDETVVVSGAATGFAVRPATLTLTDDDMAADAISLSLDPDSVAEGTTMTRVAVTAAFPADSPTLLQDTVVDITVAGDTAAASDFAAVTSFAVTIAAGQLSGTGTFPFAPVDDNVVEGDETVIVDGTTTATGVAVQSATLTLTDDDMAADTISLSLAPVSVAEDAVATQVEVTAAFPVGSATLLTDAVVTVTVAAGTAQASDFAAVAPFTVTIAAGQVRGAETFRFAPVDDNMVEGDETVIVSGATTLPGVAVQSATLTLADDDMAASTISLALLPAIVAENAQATQVMVTAAFPQGSATLPAATDVSVTVAAGTAEVSDFAAVAPFTVTIPAGQVRGTAGFSFTPMDDSLVEGSETVLVSGTTDASGVTVGSATLTLTDDDTPASVVNLSLSPASVAETAGATSVEVTAAFPAGSAVLLADVEVLITVAAGTAEMADFAAVPTFTVTIMAGQLSGIGGFQFTPVDDSLVEGSETVIVSGATTVSGVTIQPVALGIIDDDSSADTIRLFLEPASVAESAGETRIGVTAAFPEGSATLPTDTVVTVTVAAGTAQVSDFAAVAPFTVTIAAGQTRGMGEFRFAGVSDAVVENDETIIVSGVALEAGIAMVTSAVFTLIDSDRATRDMFDQVNETLLTQHAIASVLGVNRAISKRILGPGVAKRGGHGLAAALIERETLADNGGRSGRALDGLSFVQPLGVTRRSRSGFGPASVWGYSDWRQMRSHGADDWDGEVYGIQVGVDAGIGENAMTGIAMSFSRGEWEYGTEDGEIDVDSKLVSLHPYFGWRADDLSVWVSVGFGEGEVEIENRETLTRSKSDTSMTTASAGLSGEVWRAGGSSLNVKFEASWVGVDVDGSNLLSQTGLSATQLRALLENRNLHARGLESIIEIGLRHDGGDGDTGAGGELGLGLNYIDQATGIIFEGRAHGLVGHEYDEWGVSGALRTLPGRGGLGLAFAVEPSWGEDASRRGRLWDHGFEAVTGETQVGDRLRTNLSYGYPVLVSNRPAVMIPYLGLSVGDRDSRSYLIGTRIKLRERLEMALELEHAELLFGEGGNAVRLRAKATW